MNHQMQVERLQSKMKENGMHGFLVTQNIHIYYFSGTMQTGYLFIPVQGEPIFYVRRSVARADKESVIPVKELQFRHFGQQLAADFPHTFEQSSTVIATEFDVLPVQVYQRLQKVVTGVNWVDGTMLVRETRMLKDSEEVAKIKEAAHVANQALEYAIGTIKEGMPELELVSIIEYQMRVQGHTGLMRMRGYNAELVTGMVGAGEAAATPTYFDGPAGGQGLSPSSPQNSSKLPIQRNEPILIDIGCTIDGYLIDQTRTAVIGKLPEDMQRAYDVSEQILRKTESMLMPGTICEDIYFQALEDAAQAGLSEHFMGYGADQVKFLGHGIGMEIDELPVLAKGFTYPLLPGMVIAIEPKFTFPDRGVVGIENTYLITEDGWEKLSESREGIFQV